MKQNKLKISLIIGATSCLVVGFTYGNNLQQYLSEKNYILNDHIQGLPSSSFLGNVYETAYNLAYIQEQSAQKDAIEYIADYINENWQCSISKEDAYNIFSISPQAKLLSKKARSSGNDLEMPTQPFVKSCTKLLRCMNPNVETDEQLYTHDTYKICLDIVTTINNNHKSTFQAYNHLATTNIGDEMFINGSATDSPYDLLLDIEYIGQLLFSENKKVDKYSFYGNSPLEQANDFEEYFSQFPRPVGGSDNDDEGKDYLGENLSDEMKDGDGKYGKIGLGQICEDSEGCYCASQIIPNGDRCSYLPKQYDNNVIRGNNICVDGNDLSNTNNYSQTNNSSTNSNFYNDYIDDDNIDSDLSLSEIDRYIESVNSGLVGGDSDKLDSCIANCESLSSLDQPLCKLQCACKMSADPDSIYSIRFCLQKSNKRPVTDGKLVLSVEEMLDEMNNLLVNMKDNGALMKHKMSDEFWEIGLQDIFLPDIFNFDFVILFKPIYDSYSDKKSWERHKQVAVEMNKRAERNHLKNYNDMSIKADRNRYLMLRNPEVENYISQPAYDYETTQTNYDDLVMLQKEYEFDTDNVEMDKQKMANYTVLDEIGDFLQTNKIFWGTVYSTLNGFTATSKSLETKIKNQ